MSLKRLGHLRPLPMPQGLLGEAWDLIIDVHDVHVQLRGCSKSLTISHFHDEMITVRKQPKPGRESSFADTTTNEVEGVGEVSFPFLATPSPDASAELDLLPSSLRPFHSSSYSYCPWPHLTLSTLHTPSSSFFTTSQQSASTPM